MKIRTVFLDVRNSPFASLTRECSTQLTYSIVNCGVYMGVEHTN